MTITLITSYISLFLLELAYHFLYYLCTVVRIRRPDLNYQCYFKQSE